MQAQSYSDEEIFKRLGFDWADVVEDGDYYIAEGDIVFEKARMAEYLQPDTRQTCRTALISAAYQRDIKIYVEYYSGSGWAGWDEATNLAITAWNSIPGTNIILKRTYSRNSADIIVRDADFTDAIARGDFPANGKPGERVRINRYYDNYELRQKTWVMVHELGHNIGLYHTDRAVSSQEIVVPGTDDSDSLSVMRAWAGGTYWTDFSSDDKYAVQQMYPGTSHLTILGQDKINPGVLYTYQFSNFPRNIERYSVSPTPISYNGSSFSVQFSTPGPKTITATFVALNVFQGAVAYSITKNIHVNYSTPFITGPENLAVNELGLFELKWNPGSDTISWWPQPGTVSDGGFSFRTSFNQRGTHEIVATITSTNGSRQTVSFTVNVGAGGIL